MQTQTIFKAGNSSVITVPSYILGNSNFKIGRKVMVDKIDDDTMIVKTMAPSKPKKITADAAFEK